VRSSGVEPYAAVRHAYPIAKVIEGVKFTDGEMEEVAAA